MILAFLLFVVAVVRLHPDTPAARWLHEALVERPLAARVRMERRHWIALAVLCGLIFGGAVGVTGELAWMLALDSSIYVDLLIALWSASAVRMAGTVWGRVTAPFPSVTRRRIVRRAARVARIRKPGPPAANDEGAARRAA